MAGFAMPKAHRMISFPTARFLTPVYHKYEYICKD